ncbi:MAG: PrsW family intramembrane metalloprotease [Treponema sp.]|jgi:RsiW-degrading membrane proteinase PrsW (M82 family)|nr:PrsW family intramembrane metalloprotease [Treponema sp.]
MNGLSILLLLILIAGLPVILVFVWYRIARCPIAPGWFLLFLFGGASSMLIALLLQNFIPSMSGSSAAGNFFESIGPVLFNVFCRIAATEEVSRFLIFLILFPLARVKGDDAILRGTAAGLVAGLGFALVESASYGASDAGIALLRAVTSAPLHGACGARVGAAVAGLKAQPFPSIMRFLTAVAIHGMYNFMILMSGAPAIMAILAAICALASSIIFIRAGLKSETA